MRKSIAAVVVSMLLGMASPFLVGADDGPLLRTWFQWLPLQVDRLFLPEGDLAMLALAMAALTAQYLVVIAGALALPSLLRSSRTGQIPAQASDV